MFIVDRQSFIDFVDGDLLLNESGKIKKLGDKQENYEALEKLERGETIYFSMDGVIISKMHSKDGTYVEEPFNETRKKKEK